MSQAGSLNSSSGGGGGTLSTLTGNSGTATSSGANINVIGAGSLSSFGSGSTVTFSLASFTDHSVLLGTGTSTINALTNGTTGQVLTANTGGDPTWTTISGVQQTLTPNSGGVVDPIANNINLLGSGSITTIGSSGTVTISLTGLQNHSVLLGTSSNLINNVTNGTSGQVLTANTGADPTFQSLPTTSFSLTGNSGGTISSIAGNLNTVGTGSITIVGTSGTLTTQLTGLTNHAIQIGAGTATLTQLGAGTTGQVLQTNTGADPTWSTPTYPSASGSAGVILRSDGTNNVYTTATYPATTTVNQILYSSSSNAIAGLSTADNGVLTTGTTGIPSITALGSDGDLIIGSSAGAPAAGTLTAGTGIVITNGNNSITISAATETALTFDGNTGTAQPSVNVINITGTGSLTTTGSSNTIQASLTGLTNHAVLVGAGTATITKVGPNATSNIPLVSQGSSADPIFGTAGVAGGGTGLTSYNTGDTLYASAANTLSALPIGTTGQVLSVVSGVPAWSGSGTGIFTRVNMQTFSSSGVYTPTVGLQYAIVEAVGGGGGGGGAASTSGIQISVAGGGGGRRIWSCTSYSSADRSISDCYDRSGRYRRHSRKHWRRWRKYIYRNASSM